MVSCQQVISELSNFIDAEVDAGLRAEIEAHLTRCRRCSILLDSTRKTLLVFGDERVFAIPMGFSERLHRVLEEHLSRT